MNTMLAPYALGAVAATLTFQKLRARLALSRAKHRSLGGHSRISRRLAAQVPFYEYDEARFFDSDGAPAEVIASYRRSMA